mmetsp:Transcript_3997/g.5561  ORF Transcript_3997/g.5561 Transcript_3997/m.5561 type:complete len:327 (-) Transcript_3997:283-1263(-)|eukprot:CAMPEP_0117757414 /NCGR_PEP_ID=MMETSP0947-20121206/14719_1 /TAXON_ID=44440 /ORGANISM="Chattonella subsalsa, Strain CCMP2191" /LENGTH=326 /DNA_ID=CAMNT_0005577307 /DNA_START=53 /DNA_END=1033 /DNA_ORIENTATION=+
MEVKEDKECNPVEEQHAHTDGDNENGELDDKKEKEPPNEPTETMEEMLARHKKEDRELDMRIRAMIKDAKRSAGGKKAKQAAAEADAKGQQMRYDLRDKHREEIQLLEEWEETHGPKENDEETNATSKKAEDDMKKEEEEKVKLSKKEKARRKRERKAQKELERQRQIEEESKDVVSQRDIEMDIIRKKLEPLSLTIKEIPADGHCLYSAIADQINQTNRSQTTFKLMRKTAADYMRANPDGFEPFLEEGTDLQEYCNSVESTAAWGGQLEIQALSQALRLHISIFSAASPTLEMGQEFGNEPLQISYHQHYYSLGAHYNSVISLS